MLASCAISISHIHHTEWLSGGSYWNYIAQYRRYIFSIKRLRFHPKRYARGAWSPLALGCCYSQAPMRRTFVSTRAACELNFCHRCYIGGPSLHRWPPSDYCTSWCSCSKRGFESRESTGERLPTAWSVISRVGRSTSVMSCRWRRGKLIAMWMCSVKYRKLLRLCSVVRHSSDRVVKNVARALSRNQCRLDSRGTWITGYFAFVHLFPKRISCTPHVFSRTDIRVLVCDPDRNWVPGM